MTFELFDGANQSSFTATGVGTGINEFSFALFSGIDLSNIFSIALIIDGDVASDLVLNFEGFTGRAPDTSVPAPAAMWLIMAGLFLFEISRRKQKA